MTPADLFLRKFGELRDPHRYTGTLTLHLHEGKILRVDVVQAPRLVCVFKGGAAVALPDQSAHHEG